VALVVAAVGRPFGGGIVAVAVCRRLVAAGGVGGVRSVVLGVAGRLDGRPGLRLLGVGLLLLGLCLLGVVAAGLLVDDGGGPGVGFPSRSGQEGHVVPARGGIVAVVHAGLRDAEGHSGRDPGERRGRLRAVEQLVGQPVAAVLDAEDGRGVVQSLDASFVHERAEREAGGQGLADPTPRPGPHLGGVRNAGQAALALEVRGLQVRPLRATRGRRAGPGRATIAAVAVLTTVAVRPAVPVPVAVGVAVGVGVVVGSGGRGVAVGAGADAGPLEALPVGGALDEHGVARLAAVRLLAFGVEELGQYQVPVGQVLAGEHGGALAALGLGDRLVVGGVAFDPLAVIGGDTVVVAPGVAGEALAQRLDVVGAEVSDAGRGVPCGEGELTPVDGFAPLRGERADGHAGPDPPLGAADALAQLRGGELAAVEVHEPFDGPDLFGGRQRRAVDVLDEHGLDHLGRVEVPDDRGDMGGLGLDGRGVAAVAGHDQVPAVVTCGEHDQGLQDAVRLDGPGEFVQVPEARAGVVRVRHQRVDRERHQLAGNRPGSLGGGVAAGGAVRHGLVVDVDGVRGLGGVGEVVGGVGDMRLAPCVR
jgi:hypothetical protein